MSYTAIVDYGVGNLKSVTNAMKYLGLETRITSDAAELERADAIILPGVGAFPDAAERCGTGLDRTLVIGQAAKKPILGICLGMQLLFDRGEEVRPCEGLGLVHGHVERILTRSEAAPHRLEQPELSQNDARSLPGWTEGAYVYFVHYFLRHGRRWPGCDCPHGVRPLGGGGGEPGNVYGCQFHPEKSGEVGLHILKNFGGLNR